ncbi:MAG: nicotinate phosphoribosyltransferase [Alphaproteobacteria bacterium]|nr:nicotinate phosphoribosyltransferase [Alphaproteobacteria bacterium]
MINSILDTDLYKFSVSYAYFKLYPLAEGTFEFKDRNNEDLRKCTSFVNCMQSALVNLQDLQLDDNELEWCVKNIPYIPQNYWEWLKGFRFDPNKVKMGLDKNGVFKCTVTDKLYKVTLYEIAILSLFSEIRNIYLVDKSNVVGDNVNIVDYVKTTTQQKMKFANKNNIRFSEFGTRRRFSSRIHEIVLNEIKNTSKTCVGTSNVYYAMKHNMKPCGTFPHEWVMFHGAVFGYKRANYLSLEDWIKVYDGNLGIALVDTYTTESFLHTLTRKQALLLSGFRQDSGDEFEIGEMIIKRLNEFGIDAKTKTIVFSNALDMEKANKINDYFKDKVNVSFGIGTNLTCDINLKDYKPCNIVMKLMRCRISPKDEWENCIKLSDDFGKHMGDEKEIEIAKHQLHL